MKKILKYILISSFGLYIVLPLLTNLILSFSNLWKWPVLLPQNFTLLHYKKIMMNIEFWKAMYKTLVIGGAVICGNLLLAFPAAYGFSRFSIPKKNRVLLFILLPIIVPPLLILMSLYPYFIKLNLTNTIRGVIVAHMLPSLPYMFIILYLGFEKISPKYEKIYLSLGETPIKGFFKIILPQMKHSILLGGVLSFLISIGQYLSTLLIGGGSVLTLNLLLTPYINGGNSRVGAAYSVLLILFCSSFIIIYEVLILGGTHVNT